MSVKHIVTLIAGCIACVVCGFVLGFLSGSGTLSGDRLSGAGLDQKSINMENGMFIINGQKMDLGALILLLQSQRINELDKTIADQMKKIAAVNEKLKMLNEMLALCRKCSKDKIPPTKELKDLCKKYGIGMPSGDKYTDTDWLTLTLDIQSHIDSLNSQSQLDMIRLQGLINKRNQAFEMASSFLKKDQQTRDSIIGNFR